MRCPPPLRIHLRPASELTFHNRTETERNNSHPAYGTAGDKSTNGSSVQQASVAANGKTGLYNPILPAGPGENGATDYTSGAQRISGKSADSQNLGQQKSPVMQGVGQSGMASGSTSAQKDGLTYDESKSSYSFHIPYIAWRCMRICGRYC